MAGAGIRREACLMPCGSTGVGTWGVQRARPALVAADKAHAKVAIVGREQL